MSMNARSYDMESREITKRKLYDIAEGMEKITDCKFDLEYVDGYEPIINDPGIVDLVISACRKNMGEDSVKIGEYDEGSDDFSYYMNATGTSGAFTSAGMDGSSDWRFKTHLANLPIYYEYKDKGINSTDAIEGTYLDNYKQIWDLYITDSTCDPGMLSSKTGDEAESEFGMEEAVFI